MVDRGFSAVAKKTMIEKCKIGIVGVGNMGGALVAGLVAAGRVVPEHITAVDLRVSLLRSLREQGIRTSREIKSAVRNQDLVVLGVKPQQASAVLPSIGPHLGREQVLVSMMAGISTASIEAQLQFPVAVIRVMPQILASQQTAASGMCAGSHATEAQLQQVRELFDEVGSTVVVAENQMDAVAGLSGSGPAYVFTVIEALADGGVRMGLSKDVALKLTAQTVLGAARMICESGQHPAILRDQVTSPGGTTIAALHKLEEKGLRDALISAVKVATDRAAELGHS